MSKLLEKVVEHRLKHHLDINNLHDFHQSAYRNTYSTETALVKVQNDIAETLDQKSVIVLVMLDLSSAFDVIDHGIMLTRLQHSFGVTVETLDWMRSYISGRTQCVSVGPATSCNAHLCCGVPQGSELGPKLYCIYTKPVGDIVKKHNLRYHCYADNTQIYLSIKPNENWASERTAIEACVSDVGGWMNRNMLKLNQEKTHCVFVQTPNSSGERLVPHDRKQTTTCCAIREKSWSYYGQQLDNGETGECDLQILFLPHPKYWQSQAIHYK